MKVTKLSHLCLILLVLFLQKFKCILPYFLHQSSTLYVLFLYFVVLTEQSIPELTPRSFQVSPSPSPLCLAVLCAINSTSLSVDIHNCIPTSAVKQYYNK